MRCTFRLAYLEVPWLCAKYLFGKEGQVCVLFSGLTSFYQRQVQQEKSMKGFYKNIFSCSWSSHSE